jgi:hypothetical protein
MTPKVPTALRIDSALLEAMRTLKDRKGIPVTTQIEMGVRYWLKREHGITVRTAHGRASRGQKSE